MRSSSSIPASSLKKRKIVEMLPCFHSILLYFWGSIGNRYDKKKVLSKHFDVEGGGLGHGSNLYISRAGSTPHYSSVNSPRAYTIKEGNAAY